jgi:hypothetical protein
MLMDRMPRLQYEWLERTPRETTDDLDFWFHDVSCLFFLVLLLVWLNKNQDYSQDIDLHPAKTLKGRPLAISSLMSF